MMNHIFFFKARRHRKGGWQGQNGGWGGGRLREREGLKMKCGNNKREMLMNKWRVGWMEMKD